MFSHEASARVSTNQRTPSPHSPRNRSHSDATDLKPRELQRLLKGPFRDYAPNTRLDYRAFLMNVLSGV